MRKHDESKKAYIVKHMVDKCTIYNDADSDAKNRAVQDTVRESICDGDIMESPYEHRKNTDQRGYNVARDSTDF